MSTTLTHHPAATTTLTLEVSDRADVLARVVGVCLRRGCDLREVAFRRATVAGPAVIHLSLLVGPRQTGSLQAWLGALVDVRAVSERATPGR